MTARPIFVAVEGPCCAGKTTLVEGLVAQLASLQVAWVPCFADHVGGGRFLPREVPETLAEDAAGLRDLLLIERDRVKKVRTQPTDLILMDRSVHTLLSHRLGVEWVTKLPCFDPATRILQDTESMVWPSLVLYLDVSQDIIAERNRQKFPRGSILVDPLYNSAVRTYYAHFFQGDSSAVISLEGHLPKVAVLEQAARAVLHHVDEADK